MDKVSIGDNVLDTLVAVTEEEHNKGLMRTPWPPPVMSFPYETAEVRKFWMKNTISPLDILFCKNDHVIAIHEGEPLSTHLIGPNEPSDLVVELPLGTANKLGIAVGDPVHIKYSVNTVAKRYRDKFAFCA